MRKIIEIEAGAEVPEGAKFLSSRDEKRYTHTETYTDHGFLWSTRYRKNHYKIVSVYSYEVEEGE